MSEQTVQWAYSLPLFPRWTVSNLLLRASGWPALGLMDPWEGQSQQSHFFLTSFQPSSSKPLVRYGMACFYFKFPRPIARCHLHGKKMRRKKHGSLSLTEYWIWKKRAVSLRSLVSLVGAADSEVVPSSKTEAMMDSQNHSRDKMKKFASLLPCPWQAAGAAAPRTSGVLWVCEGPWVVTVESSAPAGIVSAVWKLLDSSASALITNPALT